MIIILCETDSLRTEANAIITEHEQANEEQLDLVIQADAEAITFEAEVVQTSTQTQYR